MSKQNELCESLDCPMFKYYDMDSCGKITKRAYCAIKGFNIHTYPRRAVVEGLCIHESKIKED
jgi:hypothetical protein